MSARLDSGFARAQRAYDRQEPPDNEHEECAHAWRAIPGQDTETDGARFVRCQKCGAVEESDF